jgi:hypothetical protein
VRYHKASQLVGAKVFVSKKRGIHLVSTKKQTSIDIGGNHDRYVTQMVSAEGNA